VMPRECSPQPAVSSNPGINLHQPTVRQAADACVGVTHGVVTRAVVARFVAGE
jgi:hypothetical protein